MCSNILIDIINVLIESRPRLFLFISFFLTFPFSYDKVQSQTLTNTNTMIELTQDERDAITTCVHYALDIADKRTKELLEKLLIKLNN